jgi:hypothetical protein
MDLSMPAEDLGYRHSGASLELVVEVQKRAAEHAGEPAADRGLTRTRQADEDNMCGRRRASVRRFVHGERDSHAVDGLGMRAAVAAM